MAVSKEIKYEPISTWVPPDNAKNPVRARANVIAVVKQFSHAHPGATGESPPDQTKEAQTDPTMPSAPGGDHRYNIQLQDPSVEKDEFLILTIFSRHALPFDTILTFGSVLLIRDILVSPAAGNRCRGRPA